MRSYYSSDKKRREDAKRKQREEKRLKRLAKNSKNLPEKVAETEPKEASVVESDVSTHD